MLVHNAKPPDDRGRSYPCAQNGMGEALPGISGKFYKQFALTIAASTVISAFNSLTLGPALCALMLTGHHLG